MDQTVGLHRNYIDGRDTLPLLNTEIIEQSVDCVVKIACEIDVVLESRSEK